MTDKLTAAEELPIHPTPKPKYRLSVFEDIIFMDRPDGTTLGLRVVKGFQSPASQKVLRELVEDANLGATMADAPTIHCDSRQGLNDNVLRLMAEQGHCKITFNDGAILEWGQTPVKTTPDPRKKYLCVGGDVISETDGERHYVGPAVVARLYGLNPRECLLWSPDQKPVGINPEDYIILYPDPTGQYRLPQ